VHTYADFEKWIGAAATQHGIAEGHPFAFQIRARPTSLTVTVMNRPASAIPGDKPTRAYQTSWNVGGQETDFVGFYSTQHTGVFLGAGETVHIQAVTRDRKIAGHVQDLALSPGGELLLPR
jgi:acetolactate decarboxylase